MRLSCIVYDELAAVPFHSVRLTSLLRAAQSPRYAYDESDLPFLQEQAMISGLTSPAFWMKIRTTLDMLISHKHGYSHRFPHKLTAWPFGALCTDHVELFTLVSFKSTQNAITHRQRALFSTCLQSGPSHTLTTALHCGTRVRVWWYCVSPSTFLSLSLHPSFFLCLSPSLSPSLWCPLAWSRLHS